MKGNVRFELIRHGETAYTKEHRYQGRTDLPLSDEGRAALVPVEHSRVRFVYVSPCLRARQSAEILFPNAVQIVIDDLREMDFGDFEGRTYLEMENDAAYRAWVDGGCTGRCPGGEQKDEFSARVVRAFERVLLETAVRGEEEVAVVAHGGTLMAILDHFGRPARSYFEWSCRCGCGFLTRLAEEDQQKKVLTVLEETCHTSVRAEENGG